MFYLTFLHVLGSYPSIIIIHTSRAAVCSNMWAPNECVKHLIHTQYHLSWFMLPETLHQYHIPLNKKYALQENAKFHKTTMYFRNKQGWGFQLPCSPDRWDTLKPCKTFEITSYREFLRPVWKYDRPLINLI